MRPTLSTGREHHEHVYTVEDLARELNEARDQQRATTEILSVISRSPTNVQPVFDAIVANAARLCDAAFSAVVQFEDGLLNLVAVNKMSPEETAAYHTVFPRPPNRSFIIGRAFVDGRPVHVEDIEADPLYDPDTLAVLKAAAPYRTYLGIPILRDGVPIGAIGCGRREVKPFTEAQIALVKTFADQAVIAIENARLFEEVQARTGELTELLEYQTATSEVLNVISRSPSDIQPVLDAVGENAARLCEANNAVIFRLEGDLLRQVVSYGGIPTSSHPIQGLPVDRDRVTGRAVFDRQTIHVHDLATADSDFPQGSKDARRDGHRTTLATPLLREGVPLGAILIRRMEVRPFSDRQIRLLETFADQAVIAIENARLFEEVQARTKELAEALEQQTATSEVLSVISRSPGDLGPVFAAMLGNATKLCEAAYGAMWLSEGDAFRNAAFHGELPAAFTEHWRRETVFRPGPEVPLARVARSRKPVQVADLRQDRAYLDGHPLTVTSVDAGGVRTIVLVPMLKDDEFVGAMAIYRKEVRPFTDKQVELLANFARQAVIAIENTRLLNELRESLQQQTATADVLKVISRSTFDLQTVLDTLATSAAQLCEADQSSIRRRVGDAYPVAATYGFSPQQREHLERYSMKPDRGSIFGRAVIEGRTVHIPDVVADPEWKRPDQPRATGIRAAVAVPLLREGVIVGVLTVIRTEPRAFSHKQIELLKTFADQAVIAIENTRLFEEVQARTSELTEALEQQTATSDILRVIAGTPDDAQPVFDAIAQSALRLFGVSHVAIMLREGDCGPL